MHLHQKALSSPIFTPSLRELDKAIRFLSQAIQIEPENEKNYYKRYRTHLRGKKYREALQDLSAAINLDPSDASKLLQRAK